MFKRKDVEAFFENKLECESSEGRHTGYILRVRSRKIALPYVLTLSHASGDVSRSNIKGLATDLGLSNKGLELGIRCSVGRRCVLLCAAARFLSIVIDRHTRDPIAHSDSELIRAKESVDLILSDVQDSTSGYWAAPEAKELARAEPQVRTGLTIAILKPTVERWLIIARERGVQPPT